MPAPVPEPKHKRAANLSLAPERLSFGQRYAAANHTSLSQVVEAFLGALEQSVNLKDESLPRDPLDGLLAGWPATDKKNLRNDQHEARLTR